MAKVRVGVGKVGGASMEYIVMSLLVREQLSVFGMLLPEVSYC